jgi:hypothetical protein
MRKQIMVLNKESLILLKNMAMKLKKICYLSKEETTA